MSPRGLSPDTIIAPSTPLGHGALAVVRVSGPGTLEILDRFCLPSGLRASDRESVVSPKRYFAQRPRRSVLVKIMAVAMDRGDQVAGESQFGSTPVEIDEGLVVYFPGPRSYTGEDVAEISMHGNPHLVRAFVLSVIGSGLARSAQGGEFTRRAYLSGKLDLTQAEGVRRIVEARSEYEALAGRRLLAGALSRLLSRLRSNLVGLKAETEAEVDFSTEDLTFETLSERRARALDLIGQIDEITERARLANRAVNGLQLALAGIPNAGKSSLLNQILGWERSIVSAVPGTTRDFVTEELHLDGTVVRVMDTAGLRETQEEVEREGVRRSRREIDRSQIILHVIDGSIPAYPEIADHAARAETINVVNKSDILDKHAWRASLSGADAESGSSGNPVVYVSCRTGAGLAELRAVIRSRVSEIAGPGDPLLLEDRQREHLLAVRAALQRTIDLWDQGAPQEIAALEIDSCLEEVGRITGQVTTEEVLGRIFTQFCVGK